MPKAKAEAKSDMKRRQSIKALDGWPRFEMPRKSQSKDFN